MKKGAKTLSSRPQCGHNSSGVGASRFNQHGDFFMKSDDGRWLTYPRFIAEQFSETNGVAFPQNGIRVEVINPQIICPSTLAVKIRGSDRLPLTEWVKAQKRI